MGFWAGKEGFATKKARPTIREQDGLRRRVMQTA